MSVVLVPRVRSVPIYHAPLTGQEAGVVENRTRSELSPEDRHGRGTTGRRARPAAARGLYRI